MLDIRLAPLVGATVMTETAWNKISPEDRAKVLAAASAMEKQINTEAPALDAKSIAAMTSAGLQVVKLDPAAVNELRAAAERLGGTQRGAMIPADAYDLAVRERDAFRKTKPAK